MQGRRYWVSQPPKNFKKQGKFGQNKRKFRQNNGKFCHKWQHLWLLVHPIKFWQFYKSRIFGRFNEHTPPIKVVSRRPWPHPTSSVNTEVRNIFTGNTASTRQVQQLVSESQPQARQQIPPHSGEDRLPIRRENAFAARRYFRLEDRHPLNP